jgi:hypothetical protein
MRNTLIVTDGLVGVLTAPAFFIVGSVDAARHDADALRRLHGLRILRDLGKAVHAHQNLTKPKD